MESEKTTTVGEVSTPKDETPKTDKKLRDIIDKLTPLERLCLTLILAELKDLDV